MQFHDLRILSSVLLARLYTFYCLFILNADQSIINHHLTEEAVKTVALIKDGRSHRFMTNICIEMGKNIQLGAFGPQITEEW